MADKVVLRGDALSRVGVAGVLSRQHCVRNTLLFSSLHRIKNLDGVESGIRFCLCCVALLILQLIRSDHEISATVIVDLDY